MHVKTLRQEELCIVEDLEKKAPATTWWYWERIVHSEAGKGVQDPMRAGAASGIAHYCVSRLHFAK